VAKAQQQVVTRIAPEAERVGASPRVRPDIVAAATRVFSQRGYHAASMNEVAEELGMRKPSLYHHVRKKEDLLFAIHEQLIDELIDQTTSVLLTAHTAEEKVRRILRVNMSFVARHRDGVTVFLQERRAVSGERWEELVVKRDFYEKMVSSVIAEGIASGSFVNLQPNITARGVLAMANWGYTWFDPGGELSADAVSEIFAEIALKGLLTR
jgi:TetR/AcrR family transcriptional regulator, cholesterol catabolism regulator